MEPRPDSWPQSKTEAMKRSEAKRTHRKGSEDGSSCLGGTLSGSGAVGLLLLVLGISGDEGKYWLSSCQALFACHVRGSWTVGLVILLIVILVILRLPGEEGK